MVHGFLCIEYCSFIGTIIHIEDFIEVKELLKSPDHVTSIILIRFLAKHFTDTVACGGGDESNKLLASLVSIEYAGNAICWNNGIYGTDMSALSAVDAVGLQKVVVLDMRRPELFFVFRVNANTLLITSTHTAIAADTLAKVNVDGNVIIFILTVMLWDWWHMIRSGYT